MQSMSSQKITKERLQEGGDWFLFLLAASALCAAVAMFALFKTM